MTVKPADVEHVVQELADETRTDNPDPLQRLVLLRTLRAASDAAWRDEIRRAIYRLRCDGYTMRHIHAATGIDLLVLRQVSKWAEERGMPLPPAKVGPPVVPLVQPGGERRVVGPVIVEYDPPEPDPHRYV